MTDFITVLHECKDFATWKKAFDADAPRRKAAGLIDLHLLRDHDKPNLIALMFQASDVSGARAFVESPELKATMSAAGVVGPPRVMFRRGQYTRTAAPTYATLLLNVRDYATAMTAYAMDAADRKAAGLTDLAVLQATADPNNILIIWAVNDVARATAFFDSPKLAAHMVDTAGVIGPPERHFWRV